MQERLDRVAQQWLPPAAAPSLVDDHAPAEPRTSSRGRWRVPALDARSWRLVAVLVATSLVVVGCIALRGRPYEVGAVADAPAATSSASPAPTLAAGGVVVHVTGAVRRPGLVRLPSGARVADAVAAAGGATTAKAEGSVNLARVLVDGEQVVLAAAGVMAASGAGARVSINAATAQQLEDLPGVGPVLAGRIVEFRTDHGPFGSVDELSAVTGIGEAMLGRLRPHVQV